MADLNRWVGIDEAGGRGREAGAECEDAEDGFHCASGSQGVSGGTFRGTDERARGLEEGGQCEALRPVIGRRGSTVGVDVVDVGGIHPRVGEGCPHCLDRAETFRVGRSHVESICRATPSVDSA